MRVRQGMWRHLQTELPLPVAHFLPLWHSNLDVVAVPEQIASSITHGEGGSGQVAAYEHYGMYIACMHFVNSYIQQLRS